MSDPISLSFRIRLPHHITREAVTFDANPTREGNALKQFSEELTRIVGEETEKVTKERDAARFAAIVMEEAAKVQYEEVQRLQGELDAARKVSEGLAERVAQQSELLSRRAEKREPWKCQKCGGMSWQSARCGAIHGRECLDCRQQDFGVRTVLTAAEQLPSPDVPTPPGITVPPINHDKVAAFLKSEVERQVKCHCGNLANSPYGDGVKCLKCASRPTAETMGRVIDV